MITPLVYAKRNVVLKIVYPNRISLVTATLVLKEFCFI